MGMNRRAFGTTRSFTAAVLLLANVASAQDSTLVLYDYDQIGNLMAVRRTDMRSDPLHCGAPTNVCPAGDHGRPACSTGSCTLVCDGGYLLAANRACGSVFSPGVSLRIVPYGEFQIPAPSVPVGAYYCGGAFVVAANDPTNCGACGNVCPGDDHGTPVCRAGTCSLSCAAGYLLAANGVCGSVASRGVGLRAVPYGEYLLPAPTVPAGSYYCDGAFIDPHSDPNNCGGCGNLCTPGASGRAVCSSGTCEI